MAFHLDNDMDVGQKFKTLDYERMYVVAARLCAPVAPRSVLSKRQH
jgi:hypothetical protein